MPRMEPFNSFQLPDLIYVAPELFLLLLILVLVVALFFWCPSCVHDAQLTLRVPNFPPDVHNNLATHTFFPVPAGIGGHGVSEGMSLEISLVCFPS